jgi:hypothetical protein
MGKMGKIWDSGTSSLETGENLGISSLKWARHAKHHSPPSKWGNSPPNPGKGWQKCADSWCDCLRLCWYPHISLISYSTPSWKLKFSSFGPKVWT